MKNIVFKVVLIIIVLIVATHGTLAFAVTSQDIENQKSEQNKNENEMTEIEKKQEELEQIKDETLREVEKLTTQISEYETEIESLDEQISDLNNKITEAEQKLKQAEEEYNEQEESLKQRLIVSYETGDTSYLDVMLSSESITDFISNYYLVTEMAKCDAELLDKIEKQKQEIEEAKTTLENSKKELDTSKTQKQSVQTKLKQSKNEKDTYVTQLSEEEQKLQARIEELKEDNARIDKKIAQMQAQIQEELRKQQQKNNSSSGGTSVSTGSASSSGFICPVPSYPKVTTGLYYSSGRYHGAVDFGSSGISGAPVVAVADGIVVTTERLTTSYGNYVIIAHYNGLYTLYAHGQAGSIAVSEGQKVTQGQQIMRVGNTGNSTGPHLHFEVRTSPGKYANRVNPLAYLP